MKILFKQSEITRGELEWTHVFAIPRRQGWTGNNRSSWFLVFNQRGFDWEACKRLVKEDFIVPEDAKVEPYDPGNEAAGRTAGYYFVYLQDDPDWVGYLVHKSYVTFDNADRGKGIWKV